jgi:hypothetical protein
MPIENDRATQKNAKPDKPVTEPEPQRDATKNEVSTSTPSTTPEELYEDSEGSWGDLRPPSDS